MAESIIIHFNELNPAVVVSRIEAMFGSRDHQTWCFPADEYLVLVSPYDDFESEYEASERDDIASKLGGIPTVSFDFEIRRSRSDDACDVLERFVRVDLQGLNFVVDDMWRLIACIASVEISRSLTSQFFLYMLNNGEINAVMEREFGGSNREKAKFSMPCNCMSGKSVELPVNDLMNNAKMRENQYNLEFLRRGVASAIISVHDEIKRRGLDDKEEDMEFLRHIRNACGHGNRFTFRGDEPKRTAKLMELEITKDLEGTKEVLFNFITIGDAIILLDSVARRLDPSAAPPHC